MPKHNYILEDGLIDPSDVLQDKGPLIKIIVSPPKSLKEFLLQQGKTPASVTGWGVIDTGASTTCVSKSVLEKIGGQPVSTKEVRTPGEKKELDVYPAKISFPATALVRNFDEALCMIDLDIEYKGIPIVAFLGREILSNCEFVYNGKTGKYSLEC